VADLLFNHLQFLSIAHLHLRLYLPLFLPYNLLVVVERLHFLVNIVHLAQFRPQIEPEIIFPIINAVLGLLLHQLLYVPLLRLDLLVLDVHDGLPLVESIQLKLPSLLGTAGFQEVVPLPLVLQSLVPTDGVGLALFGLDALGLGLGEVLETLLR